VRVLNVGCNLVPISPEYRGWQQVRLDIDARAAPDICMDARRLTASDLRAQFDAVYAASFLEHLCEPDIAKTLAGFAYVLRGDGFVDLRVPDSLALMRYMVEHDLDLDTVLYTSAVGPIRACDVLWGYQKELASGRDFFAHRFGFSQETICNLLAAAGFHRTSIGPGYGYLCEMRVMAYKQPQEGV